MRDYLQRFFSQLSRNSESWKKRLSTFFVRQRGEACTRNDSATVTPTIFPTVPARRRVVCRCSRDFLDVRSVCIFLATTDALTKAPNASLIS
jgi:hypothetical protein